MVTKIYDFKKQYAGDTFRGLKFTCRKSVDGVLEPLDLTNVLIKMQIKLNTSIIKTFNIGEGITLLDAINGVFTLDPFVNLRQGYYNYDIEFTYLKEFIPYNEDLVTTYLKGTYITIDK